VAGRSGSPLGAFPLVVPALVAGRLVAPGSDGTGVLRSTDPCAPGRVVAEAASCTAEHADAALAAARGVAERWRRTPADERAAVLFAAAEWMRQRRSDLAALEVAEAAKPWAEADGDVCEAIDFCEYYGREALRLAAGGAVQSPPGERNLLRYEPRGPTVVVAPWNFPLAIPTGMAVAALVAGNPVILKPAEQAPGVAWQLAAALRAALESGDHPPEAFQFLPGTGEAVGAALVSHPDVAAVAFTGSAEVGLGIVETVARRDPRRRHVTRVVAEMGGKNAIVVDADADLDAAIPAIVSSAFGYAGQKCSACSRLVVLDEVHDAVVERLAATIEELHVAPASDPACAVPALIEAGAQARVRGWIARAVARPYGRLVVGRDRPEDLPADGWFVGPTLFDHVEPDSPLAQEELFGPVLAVLRARDLDDALAIANHSRFALTAGIFSRSPTAIARAEAELRAGNVYVNRGTTGAVVGRQPFGGGGLSGVGSKAGGPDYLLQFCEPRTVSENTVRQGFAPDGWRQARQ
jgi:RHH-type transcriptional regulator, proline utilization regulon repressor / proline dehydrogenase / delta 1-pyrroline-5-carboxylate dehydrogenase